MTSFYLDEELQNLGFKFVGDGCCISRNAKFYGINNISIGHNVRIDDFCILSGNVTIGSNIHIGPYVALYGSKGIVLEDYTGISARSTIYSAMDDFNGDYLVGPIHKDKYTNVNGGEVRMNKYSQLCAHSLVFPNVTIGEGAVIGACSMVKYSVEPWGIYAGVPVRKIKERRKNMLSLLGIGV